MHEKRRYKRLPIQLNLEVSEVFKQDNNIISDLNAEIHVFDISKAGIGFTTQTYLPEGYYFNATIILENSDQKILTVVKILNVTQLDDGNYIKVFLWTDDTDAPRALSKCVELR